MWVRGSLRICLSVRELVLEEIPTYPFAPHQLQQLGVLGVIRLGELALSFIDCNTSEERALHLAWAAE